MTSTGMMKVACTWEDVKQLRQDMDKGSHSTALHCRSKLLQAAMHLQTAVGLQDLGQLYYQPIKDNSGTVVLVTVNSVSDMKNINSSNVKWMSVHKLLRRLQPNTDQSSAHDILFMSLPEKVNYHRACHQVLDRGLYLGYLKLRSSVDLLRVLVRENTPNVLPHVKIRTNPHVSRVEWEWLQNLDANQVKGPPTAVQQRFQELIKDATVQLLEELGVTEDQAVSHRLYDVEVVELSHDVTFLLLLPPMEEVCSVPGQSDHLAHREGFLSLPVQIFEMIHMCTYQKPFICRYSRLSSLLEMNSLMAQHAHREAFSPTELSTAKDRVRELQTIQNCLDDAWKGRRWIMDVLTYARDKQVKGGVPLGVLYAPPPSPNDSPMVDHRLVSSSSATTTSEDHGVIATEFADLGEEKTRLPGILRIYAAYDTGLARGTSIKLHVTPRTTAREVINLVVQQLNKTVLMKGLSEPIYTEENLGDFCLVAVIGSRERCMPDDYQPLQLQNPWTKGRLFVRLKTNLLAAIEHGNATAV
ncbi:PREDICTED: ankyrin repeat and fibronectin type-III domain-containing protein 1-like [Priapulus caudatus]|uniref:Ankyrin repeat and fibronectin type-III domain-containing protein 1-like n=1 Tax=Priapulus caudatus TaxID=37621 RepID=A0ABM1E6T2_PRICU|nr:PREDICTED: ankyrin repeat and fibronectin type-III domain-containing protein 1-like [Priapulus caudatus]